MLGAYACAARRGSPAMSAPHLPEYRHERHPPRPPAHHVTGVAAMLKFWSGYGSSGQAGCTGVQARCASGFSGSGQWWGG